MDKATREANTRRWNELAVLAHEGSEEATVELWYGMKKFGYKIFWSWRNSAPHLMRSSYHFDDPEGVIASSFMDAIKDYDVSKSAFITFYGVVLENDLGHIVRRTKQEKRDGDLDWKSIDEPTTRRGKSGSFMAPLGELIPLTVDFDTGLDIEKMLALVEGLTERERYIVQEYYLKDELSQAEIGLVIGMSQAQVCRILKKVIHTLRIGLLGQENVS